MLFHPTTALLSMQSSCHVFTPSGLSVLLPGCHLPAVGTRVRCVGPSSSLPKSSISMMSSAMGMMMNMMRMAMRMMKMGTMRKNTATKRMQMAMRKEMRRGTEMTEVKQGMQKTAQMKGNRSQ